MFSPDNQFKSYWDSHITAILLFTCIVTPANLAFTFSKDDEKDNNDSWVIVNAIIDSLFTLDIIFNFNTAFIDEDFRVIANRKTIAKSYLRGWFTVDVIAVFQFNWIFP